MDSSSGPAKDDTVSRGDLRAAFAIFLGRPPEDVAQQEAYWATRAISELLGVLAGSDEFANIQNHLVDEGVLFGGERLSAAELREADLWLARIEPAHTPGPRTGWCALLLGAVTSAELTRLDGPVLSTEAVAVLRDMVAVRHSAQADFEALVAFDPAAFCADPANRQYCSADGAVDFNLELRRNDARPVMLAPFTEGLKSVGRSGAITLGEWLHDTQDAALAGSLGHWLWDETTYRRNRAMPDRELESAAPDGLVFLEFLMVGDEAKVSPHPLFCYYAYGKFNAVDSGERPGEFRQYLAKSRAVEARTSALFDPEFYLSRQPHVRMDIASGLVRSALDHFVRAGMAAGYDFCPDFDRAFYLAANPDVAQALADGAIPSAEWHYVFQGSREGRSPNPFFDAGYYIARYPSIPAEMARLGIATSLEHFILIGQRRGWMVNPSLAERAVSADDGRALLEKRGRRAYGEIIDGGISIPAAEVPRLSVIVPVSNQADFTAGFLKSAAFAIEVLRARRDIETEVLVVDSGSRDHTAVLLASLPHIVIVKPEASFSFPAAVNAGVARARGDIVLVVNNDIEVQPDAFDRVFAVLDEDASVGLVGAKTILPNETLQELGVSVDRTGNPYGLGRGVDAFRVVNNRRLEVDYVSGCFMAFRRADFDALSGFDETFSPGYYEDVDFALRVKRDLGKSTVVDTGLSVIHYENASFAKGRPSLVNVAGAIRNRSLLKIRHAELFRTRRRRTAFEHAANVRHALFGSDRVLLIQDQIPASGRGTYSARAEALGRMGIAFDILALNPNPHADTYKDPRVGIFRGWLPGQALYDVLAVHGADYSHVWVCGTENLAKQAGILVGAKADAGFKIVCEVEDLQALRSAGWTSDGRALADDDAGLWKLGEALDQNIDVDLWVTVTERDRAKIEKLGIGPAVAVGVAWRRLPESASPQPFADRHRIVLLDPNGWLSGGALDDLERLLSQNWPTIEGVAAKLTILGECDPVLVERIRGRFSDRVEITGLVDDDRLTEIYAATRVAIVLDQSIESGAATAAEAVLSGVPVVMTKAVAARLEGAESSDAAPAPSGDETSLGEQLGRLYSQERAWRSALKKQRLAIDAAFRSDDPDTRLRAALNGVDGDP